MKEEKALENGTAIQMQKLHKRFGDFTAVKSLDLSIKEGEIFSLLGPNGAGKSTIISMLSCLLLPTSGDALVMGHSIRHSSRQVKQAIGLVPQEIAIYEDLSARDNLLFWGRMAGLKGSALKPRVAQVLEMVGLSDRQNGCSAKFSGGMKRRLNIGIALLHEPQLVIMDERKGRRYARRLALSLTGTLGVLLLAKEQGLITAVAPLLEQLLDEGLYFAPSLIEQTLLLAQEA